MKCKNLSLALILLSLLCPSNTNARTKPRPIKPWQTRLPEAKTRSNTVEGYVTQSSGTAKHVWTEVYLHEYGWVPFDPTWADKKNPWIRKHAFDTLKPVYIYFTHIRNDNVLDNYHLYWDSYWGDKVKVKDSIEFRQSDIDQRGVRWHMRSVK